MILEYDGRKKPEYKGCIIKRWNPNYEISNILDENLESTYSFIINPWNPVRNPVYPKRESRWDNVILDKVTNKFT